MSGEDAQRRRRSTAARLGALKVDSMYDSKELTKKGRAAFMARFEQQVDPDGLLDPAERARRAEYAKRAYFMELALRSAKARARREGDR